MERLKNVFSSVDLTQLQRFTTALKMEFQFAAQNNAMFGAKIKFRRLLASVCQNAQKISRISNRT